MTSTRTVTTRFDRCPYDGDQCTCKILMSQEANEEAEKIERSVSYILDLSGRSIRSVGNEAIQTLYELTKDPS